MTTMTNTIRRTIALVLTLTLLLGLMAALPASPASAADGDLATAGFTTGEATADAAAEVAADALATVGFDDGMSLSGILMQSACWGQVQCYGQYTGSYYWQKTYSTCYRYNSVGTCMERYQ